MKTRPCRLLSLTSSFVDFTKTFSDPPATTSTLRTRSAICRRLFQPCVASPTRTRLDYKTSQGRALRETAALPCAKAHGKSLYAHGKGFAVCRTRQRAHGIQTSANLCRVPKLTLGKQFSKKIKKTSAAAAVAVPATTTTPPATVTTTTPARQERRRRRSWSRRRRRPRMPPPASQERRRRRSWPRRRLPRAPQPAVAGPPTPTGTPAGRHSGPRRRRPRAPLPAAVRGRASASRERPSRSWPVRCPWPRCRRPAGAPAGRRSGLRRHRPWPRRRSGPRRPRPRHRLGPSSRRPPLGAAPLQLSAEMEGGKGRE